MKKEAVGEALTELNKLVEDVRSLISGILGSLEERFKSEDKDVMGAITVEHHVINDKLNQMLNYTMLLQDSLSPSPDLTLRHAHPPRKRSRNTGGVEETKASGLPAGDEDEDEEEQDDYCLGWE
jgi:hypothetical protein